MALPFQNLGGRVVVSDDVTGLTDDYVVAYGTPRLFIDGRFVGEYINLNAALVALEAALGQPPPILASPNGTRVPDDGDEIIDNANNVWAIDSQTGQILRNNQWFNGGSATTLLWLDDEIYAKSAAGRWYKWVEGTGWVDQGVGDPELPDPSPAWFTVPDDGATITDLLGQQWSLGTQFGAGYDILKNGTVYGGWASRLKLDDDLVTVWCENPSGLGWIKEDPDHIPAFWENPVADPEGGGGEPPPPPAGSGVTIGTIDSSNLNIITVQDTTPWTDELIAAGLAYVIVETGKEPGMGAPGTRGVGGQWPSQLYNNATERNATTGATNQHVGQLDTGDVWAWSGGQWVNRADGAIDSSNGALRKIMPHALVARVTSVNRVDKKLTINQSAAMAVTNATVYLDGAPIIQAAFNALSDGSNPADPGNTATGSAGIGGPFDWPTITLGTVNLNTLFPTYDSVALGGPVVVNNRRYIRLTQNSTTSFQVFAPRGAPGSHFEFKNCTGVLVDNLAISGNNRVDNGYCLQWGGSGSVTPNWGHLTDIVTDAFSGAYIGVVFILSSGCEFRNSTIAELSTAAQTFICSKMMFRNIVHNRTDPPLIYAWHILHSGCSDSWLVDCSSNSNHIHGGYELFQCSGGGIVRPLSRNGWISFNDCGSGYMCGADQANLAAGGGTMRATLNALVGTENYPGSVFVGWSTPMISINTSQNSTESQIGGTYPSGYKGIVQGVTMIVEDYTKNGNDTVVGIKINDNNPDIRVIGNTYIGKNFVTGGRVGGAVGIQASGPRCVVNNNVISGISAKSGQSRNIWGSRVVEAIGNTVNTPDEIDIFNLG
jgi:hypothetical protein